MGNKSAVRLPLWVVLNVPFTAILLISAVLVAYLGFQNGVNTASDLTRQLVDEASGNVQQNLESFFTTASLLTDQLMTAIRMKHLDLGDLSALKQRLLAYLYTYETLQAVGYGNEQGEFSGAFRADDIEAGFTFGESSKQTNFTYEDYEADPLGQPGNLIFSIPNYDPRTKPWYQAAVQAGQLTWTPLYAWISQYALAVDVVAPVYDENGTRLGVIGVSLNPASISEFLQNLSIRQKLNIFIVDDSGLLVASSTMPQPYTHVDGKLQRFDTLTATDPFVQSATRRVIGQFGSWSAIGSSQQFEFEQAGEKSLAQVTPYEGVGSRWWIVVAIPEATFITPINNHISETLLLIIGSLLVSVALLTLVSWQITHPILRLSQASKALARGNLSEKVVVNRRDELGDLAISFNQMADQLQQSTASLQASEARFRTIIETAPLGIAFARDGLILYENRKYLEIFGYQEPEEVNGLPFVHQFAVPNRDEFLERVRLQETGETVLFHYETIGLRRDSSQFPVAVWITRMNFPDGAANVGFHLDLTERKQAEVMMQEQSRLQLVLEKQKNLSSLKSRFFYMASHEFRTPLAAILATTETLTRYRERLTDEQITERLNNIGQHVNHLKAIIENMLNLARIQARRIEFNPATLNLDALCTSVLDEFRSQLDIKHEFLYTCNDPQRKAILDPQLMRQIMTNLISNAVKYSPETRPISVKVEYTNEAIILKVSDTGIGIPAADLKQLFEPFHRAENVGTISGTGLGLVITKELVELHGGIITVESQVGVGTTFTINIPQKLMTDQ
jgi:PAS domain S-box-containing protein